MKFDYSRFTKEEMEAVDTLTRQALVRELEAMSSTFFDCVIRKTKKIREGHTLSAYFRQSAVNSLPYPVVSRPANSVPGEMTVSKSKAVRKSRPAQPALPVPLPAIASGKGMPSTSAVRSSKWKPVIQEPSAKPDAARKTRPAVPQEAPKALGVPPRPPKRANVAAPKVPLRRAVGLNAGWSRALNKFIGDTESMKACDAKIELENAALALVKTSKPPLPDASSFRQLVHL